MTSVEKITASLFYDTSSVTLTNPTQIVGKFSQEESDIVLTFDTNRDIIQGTKLVTWDIAVSTPESHTINLSDVEVTTSTGTISLSTRGTGAF